MNNFIHIIFGGYMDKVKYKTIVSKYTPKENRLYNALISFSKMGFPENWERLPLFEEMLRNQ